MEILIIGDIMGRPGRNILKREIHNIIKEYNIDLVIVNGENASGGNGLTKKNADELLSLPISSITMGNHVWDKKEIYEYIEDYSNIIRPANYPDPCPGKGYYIFKYKEIHIGIINLSGLVYMQNLNCPFMAFDKVYEELKNKCEIILVDFHAEATSEKIAMGYYIDGKVTAIYGTHTHVQTADHRILPKGSAYITDIGMTGPYNGVLGIDKEIIINHFLSKRPKRFDIAKGEVQINGMVLSINNLLKCEKINPFIKIYKN